MIGKIVGNYRFEAKIGEGGVGEVYRATDTLLDRPVAIKALRADLATQSRVLTRFRAEAQVLARLNHTHIATLYAMVVDDDGIWMVMEYVEGQTFAEIVRRCGPVPANRAVSWFRQALDGIGYAHEHGIIHRDIKGSNIMLSSKGVVKVMDFGIARALGSSRLTRHGHLVGTLQYMSPEQVRGRETDARSDIYSLGVVLFHLVTGRVPFRSKNDYELMHAQIESPPPSPRDLVPSLPEAFERAVLRALAKSPAERFATTGEFKSALEQCELPPLDDAASAWVVRRAPAEIGDAAADTTRLTLDGETDGESTLRWGRPTEIDATVLEPRAPRLERCLARAREHRGAMAALALVFALALGVNLLVLGRSPAAPRSGAAAIAWAELAEALLAASLAAKPDRPLDRAEEQVAAGSAAATAGAASPGLRADASGAAPGADRAVDSRASSEDASARGHPAERADRLAVAATAAHVRRTAAARARATPRSAPRAAASPTAAPPDPESAVRAPRETQGAGGQEWIIERN